MTRINKIRQAFDHISLSHTLLHAYQSRQVLARQVAEASICLEHLLAQDIALDDMILGVDVSENDVKCNRPGLLSLVFPYLYPQARGH